MGLAEYVFDFSAEAPGSSLVESFFNIGELFEQPLLLAGQSSRRDDRSDHKQIAASVALQRDDAFAFETEDGTGLCAFRDGQRLFAVERGNTDLRAQGGLSEGDGNVDVEIIALTFEDVVFFDVDHHIEIAGRPGALASLALAGQ